MTTQQITYPLVALGTGLDVVFSIRGSNPNLHLVSYFSIIRVAFGS